MVIFHGKLLVFQRACDPKSSTPVRSLGTTCASKGFRKLALPERRTSLTSLSNEPMVGCLKHALIRTILVIASFLNYIYWFCIIYNIGYFKISRMVSIVVLLTIFGNYIPCCLLCHAMVFNKNMLKSYVL